MVTELLKAVLYALLFGGGVFLVCCVAVSHLRFQALTHSLHPPAPVEDSGVAAQRLEAEIVRRMATVHRTPPPFVVVLVEIPELAAVRAHQGEADAQVLFETCVARLRSAVRAGDHVQSMGANTVGLVLSAGRPVAARIAARLTNVMNGEPLRAPGVPSLRAAARLGVACFPEEGDKASVLRAKAVAQLEEAVLAAGSGAAGAADVSVDQAHRHAGASEGEEQTPLLDELTGVLQESRMSAALQKYVAQYRREDLPVAMFCLDVDYLRRYNEQYGRRTGDQLLRHVADYLKAHTREQDLIARHAGDQFVVTLQATTAQGLAVAQRVWTGLRKTAFEGSGPGLRLTATVGVSGYPEHGSSARELFEAAQLALMAGKAKGRNACLLFQPSMRRLAGSGEAGDAF